MCLTSLNSKSESVVTAGCKKTLKFKNYVTASVIISIRSTEWVKDIKSWLNFECSSAVTLKDALIFHHDWSNIARTSTEGRESTSILEMVSSEPLWRKKIFIFLVKVIQNRRIFWFDKTKTKLRKKPSNSSDLIFSLHYFYRW